MWRRKYLRQIKELRKQKKNIYYLDETWVNSGHVRSKIWVDQNVMSKRELFNQDLSAGLKNPSGRGKRLIVVQSRPSKSER
jgi:hypothetical protein